MKFGALRDFLAVAERGSLRAAARHLGHTQPAISRSIQELERELGVALFERRSTGVHLTSMGQTFLGRATAVNNELQRAKEELDQMRGEVHGRLKVAMSSVPHIALLPNALRPFQIKYPDVHIELIDAVFPTIEMDLKNGQLDCYVGPVPNQIPPELHAEKLFDNTRVIVGRKGHPLAKAQSIKDLANAEWITTSITHKAEEEIAPLFALHGLASPKLAMRAHSALSYLTAVYYSDLLMMVPVQWIQSPLLRQAVDPIRVKEVLPALPISLVRRHGLPLTPAAEYFCDMIRRAVLHRESL